MSLPPRGRRPLRDAGESRSVVPCMDSMARPSALHLEMAPYLSLTNRARSSAVTPLHGTGRACGWKSRAWRQPSGPSSGCTRCRTYLACAGQAALSSSRPGRIRSRLAACPNPPCGALLFRRQGPPPARALLVVPASEALALQPAEPPVRGARRAPCGAADSPKRIVALSWHGRLQHVPGLAWALAPVHPFQLCRRHVGGYSSPRSLDRLMEVWGICG